MKSILLEYSPKAVSLMIIIFFFLLFSFKFYYVAVVFSLSIISDDFEIIIL